MGERKSTDKSARDILWRRVLAGLKIAVSVGILWLLSITYDIGESFDRLAGVALWSLLLAGGLFAIMIVLATVRWRIILVALGENLPFWPTTGIVMIGLFFNQVLPSNLGGDAMRIWRLHRRGSGLGRAVGSVMLDRVIALVALALLVLATLPLAAGHVGDVLILSVFWMFIAMVPIGVAVLLWLDRVLVLFVRIFPRRVFDALQALARDARTVLLDRRYCMTILACALSNQILLVLIMMSLAYGLGMPARFSEFIVLIPPVILATVIPLSFAGWGVREGAMVALLGTIDIGASDAIALSVSFGLVILVGSLPGGLVWFLTGNRQRAVEAQKAGPGKDGLERPLN